MAERKSTEIEKLKSTNKVLIITLIIAAFFLGSLTNKVSTMEKNTAPSIAAGDVNASPAPTAATKKPKAVSASDHIRGNVAAKVTLIEYSDFECPFCKNFEPTLSDLFKTYGDKIRLVYRHYPLPFHQNAEKEAEASECVANIGNNDAFWKFSDAIYSRTTSNGTGFALDALGPLATEAGVDQQQFQNCLDSGKYAQLIKDSTAEGSAAGVSGTPSTFIIDAKGNSQLVVGAQPIDAFKTVIDKALTVK